MRILATILLLCLVLANPVDVAWAQSNQCANYPPITVVEEPSRYFSLHFSEPLDGTERIFISQKNVLDKEYETFKKFYGIDLTFPITIRFYKDELEYNCSNFLSEELASARFHTVIGQREMAFLRSRMHSEYQEVEFINAFRSELVGLFVNKITDNRAPAGLKAGIQLYSKDPQYTALQYKITAREFQYPTQSWRYVWENQDSSDNQFLQLYALSITAYLIDTYGWLRFVTFINHIPKVQNYRQALTNAYNLDFSVLENQWKQYYPLYFTERWPYNIFFNTDLTSIERLISAGAYIDAVEAAKATIVFLEATGQPVDEAQDLLEMAQRGEKIGMLVTQARRAFLQGSYHQSIDLAQQALAAYAELGDERRTEELYFYITHSEEILQKQLDVQNLIESGRRDTEALNLMQVYSDRLSALGDQETPKAVEVVFEQLEENKKEEQNRLIFQYLGITLFLLIIRILLIRIKPPPESL